LSTFAKTRAAALGVPLSVRGSRRASFIRKNFKSLGGPAPYEYVDAEGGGFAIKTGQPLATRSVNLHPCYLVALQYIKNSRRFCLKKEN